eukprot:scpid27252/ scgid12929/ 
MAVQTARYILEDSLVLRELIKENLITMKLSYLSHQLDKLKFEHETNNDEVEEKKGKKVEMKYEKLTEQDFLDLGFAQLDYPLSLLLNEEEEEEKKHSLPSKLRKDASPFHPGKSIVQRGISMVEAQLPEQLTWKEDIKRRFAKAKPSIQEEIGKSFQKLLDEKLPSLNLEFWDNELPISDRQKKLIRGISQPLEDDIYKEPAQCRLQARVPLSYIQYQLKPAEQLLSELMAEAYVKIGYIKEIQPEERKASGRIFIIPKTDGTHRLIYD